MKRTALIIQIIGTALSLAGVICLMIAYSDKLMGLLTSLKEKTAQAKEYEDFADVE